MKLNSPAILIFAASLILIVISCLIIYAFISNMQILGFSFLDATLTLSVALIIEAPQSIGRSVLLLFYEGFRGLRGRSGGERQITVYPRVSVIVPAHNEEEYIGGTLQSLLEDVYPNKEIIVVDDGSTDKTYAKAMMFARDPRVKVVRREVASGAKARAVDFGLMFAKGDVVVVVDGDTVVERESIRELVSPMLRDPEIIGVAGNIKVLNSKNLLTRLQSYEYLLSMEMGRRWQGILGGILVIPGAFGAIRRDVLESLGRMHSDTITEDFDMTVMLQKVRKKIAFAPKAVAWTHAPERWRDWMRQRRRWSSGQAQVYLKHSNIFFRRRFGLFGSLIAPNNIFMDMVALFIRYSWLAALFLLSLSSADRVLRLIALISSFYLTLEFIQLVSAALLTPRKEGLKNAFLAPLMIPYRSLYAIVRLTAYLNVFLGGKTRW